MFLVGFFGLIIKSLTLIVRMLQILQELCKMVRRKKVLIGTIILKCRKVNNFEVRARFVVSQDQCQ